MKKLYVIFLMLMTVSVYAAPESSCSKMVEYYANVIMTSDSYEGMSEAFPITLKELVVRTEDELEMVKAMPVFQDSSYLWVQKGKQYVLYRIDPQTGKKRLDLYQAVFLEHSYNKVMRRMQAANSENFLKYDLSRKMKILAVMGVGREGRRQKVDFVTHVDFPAQGSQYKEVFVRNADHHLLRYAKSMGFDVNDSPDVALADFYTVKGYNSVMGTAFGGRETEQYILDAYVNGNQSFLNVTGGDMQTDETKPNNLNIKFEYLNCIPKGDDNLGHAKAVFIPLVDNDGVYTVYVYPGAFGSTNTLVYFIKRALYHARWWNIAANMSSTSFAREAYMRMSLPYLEYEFYQQYAAMIADDTGTDDLAIRLYEHTMLLDKLIRSIQTVKSNVTDYKLPWVYDQDIIIPETIGAKNEFRWAEAPQMLYENMTGKAEKAYQAAAAYKAVGSSLKTSLDSLLADMVMLGCSRAKEVRTAVLQGAMKSMDEKLASWRAADNDVSEFDKLVNLFTKIYDYEYQYHDLEWIEKLTEGTRSLSGLTQQQKNFFKYIKEYALQQAGDGKYYRWFPYELSREKYLTYHPYQPSSESCTETKTITVPVPGGDEGDSLTFNLKYDKYSDDTCKLDADINSADSLYNLLSAIAVTSRQMLNVGTYIQNSLTSLAGSCSEIDNADEKDACTAVQNALGSITATDLVASYESILQRYFLNKSIDLVKVNIQDLFNQTTKYSLGTPDGAYTDYKSGIDEMNKLYAKYYNGYQLNKSQLNYTAASKVLRTVFTEWRRLERELMWKRILLDSAVGAVENRGDIDSDGAEHYSYLADDKEIGGEALTAASAWKDYVTFKSFVDEYRAAVKTSQLLHRYWALGARLNDSPEDDDDMTEGEYLKKKYVGAFSKVKTATNSFMNRYYTKIINMSKNTAYKPDELRKLATAVNALSRVVVPVQTELAMMTSHAMVTDGGQDVFDMTERAMNRGFSSREDAEEFIEEIYKTAGLTPDGIKSRSLKLADHINSYSFKTAASEIEQDIYQFLQSIAAFDGGE